VRKEESSLKRPIVKNAKLILVEDNPVLSRMIPLQMTKYGYEVVSVFSRGEDALKKSAELQFDLILMDIDLGGAMDGVTAAQALQRTKDVPVVFITSHDDKEMRGRTQSIRFSTCLAKPFTEREVALTIELSLQRARYEREREVLVKKIESLQQRLPNG